MKNCLTKKILFKEVSGCLVENPECGFAIRFGFSFVCSHPEHAQFHAHVVGVMTKDEAAKRYATLKQKRRDEFVSRLDEESRKFFCHSTDFHGQPLSRGYE